MQRPDGLDECTREMFALAMLVRLGKVTERDVRQTFSAFRLLDVDNDGVLNSRTIIAGMMHKRRSRVLHSIPDIDLGEESDGQPEHIPLPPPIPADMVSQQSVTNEQPFQFLIGNRRSLYTTNLGGTCDDEVEEEEEGVSFVNAENASLLHRTTNYGSYTTPAFRGHKDTDEEIGW